MEERLLKKTALFVMTVSVLICLSVPFLSGLGEALDRWFASVRQYRLQEEEKRLRMTPLELLADNNNQAGEEAISSGKLWLKLPLGVSGDDVEIREDYLTQTVEIQIPYAGEQYLHEYPMLGTESGITEMIFENKQGYGILDIVTDRVYHIQSSQDSDYLYLEFLTSQEVYDKVVVIDAGHGGKESGTVKQGIYEKDINLDILLKLKEMIDASGDPSIGVYYTRTSDVDVDTACRAQLADKTGADLFVSIHSNATKSGRMSSIHGTQALYDADGEGSMEFAQICLEEVTAAAKSSNKGLIQGQGEDMIHTEQTPAAWIETGFMTNQEELNNLCSEEYQQKIAQGIYQALMRAFAQGF